MFNYYKSVPRNDLYDGRRSVPLRRLQRGIQRKQGVHLQLREALRALQDNPESSRNR